MSGAGGSNTVADTMPVETTDKTGASRGESNPVDAPSRKPNGVERARGATLAVATDADWRARAFWSWPAPFGSAFPGSG